MTPPPADANRSSPHSSAQAAERERWQELKTLERVRLLYTAMPLIAAGLGVAVLYAWLAASSGLPQFWFGPGLAGPGAALLASGYAGRLREFRSRTEPTSRHYPLLLVGGVLVVAGALVPPYALA